VEPVFDAVLYQVEMSRLLRDAADAVRRHHRGLVIYTVSVWTDPNAAVSAVSVDTRENSEAQLAELAAWAQARRAEALAAGDPAMAALLGALPPRNRNPAGFALREIASVEHRAFPANWDEVSRGDCWLELGPALSKVRADAVNQFAGLSLHPEAELAVNGPRDWYDEPVRLCSRAI
jgi:hypothetical protein